MPTYHRNHVIALMRRAGHSGEIATASQVLPDIVDPGRGKVPLGSPGLTEGGLTEDMGSSP